MLYIISFQSISCREASLTSPRPHKGPPEGISERGFGPGLFPRSSPQSSTRFPSRCSARSSGRSSPQSSTRFPSRCLARPSGRSSPQSSTRFPSRCSALSSGRSLKTILKPAREAVFATVTQPTGISEPSRRGKAVIYHPFATATLSTGTPVASRRAEQSNNLSQTGL